MSKQDKLKRFLAIEFRSKRACFELSQEKMAEILMISPRSYIDLEHGKYLCSTSVFIAFVVHFEIDKDDLFNKLKSILDEEYTDAA